MRLGGLNNNKSGKFWNGIDVLQKIIIIFFFAYQFDLHFNLLQI
jgi:hypothetical protein